tara:strand:+ start:2124 stop:2681 length:558 start_codon:yes stop_codon:yes gene_type:complete
MEEIKNWYKNFNYKQNFIKETIKENMYLYTHFENDKDIYLINYVCKGKKNNYLKYFYDPLKIKEINKNIQNIFVFKTGKKSQIIDLSFNINTENINVGILKKKEEMFLEDHGKGFVIYSKNLPLDKQDILEIKKGYNIVSVQEEEDNIRINIIIEVESNIPFIFKKIPALIIIKSLLNFENLTEG